jgi:hypothetical protein
MVKKPLFLITSSYHGGLSRAKFRRLPKEKKFEAMLEWFHSKYEDLANRLPCENREGGYQ